MGGRAVLAPPPIPSNPTPYPRKRRMLSLPNRMCNRRASAGTRFKPEACLAPSATACSRMMSKARRPAAASASRAAPTWRVSRPKDRGNSPIKLGAYFNGLPRQARPGVSPRSRPSDSCAAAVRNSPSPIRTNRRANAEPFPAPRAHIAPPSSGIFGTQGMLGAAQETVALRRFATRMRQSAPTAARVPERLAHPGRVARLSRVRGWSPMSGGGASLPHPTASAARPSHGQCTSPTPDS